MKTKGNVYMRGISLLEIIIVLAITAILITLAIKPFFSLNNNQAVQTDSLLIVETLTQARSQTLASKNQTQYGVHFASTTISLFSGSTYNASNTGNNVYLLNNKDKISSISLTGGGSDIIFTRLTGETSQNGTIVVSSVDASTTKTVTIYKTGLFESK